MASSRLSSCVIKHQHIALLRAGVRPIEICEDFDAGAVTVGEHTHGARGDRHDAQRPEGVSEIVRVIQSTAKIGPARSCGCTIVVVHQQYLGSVECGFAVPQDLFKPSHF